jgi:hypothetical protein
VQTERPFHCALFEHGTLGPRRRCKQKEQKELKEIYARTRCGVGGKNQKSKQTQHSTTSDARDCVLAKDRTWVLKPWW